MTMERLNEPYPQEEWGARVAIDFFLGGAGSGLVAFYLLNLSAFGENYGLGLFVSVLSLVFILAGLALLASELGQPSYLWRSMARIRKSWMARGSLFNLALLITLMIMAGSFLVQASVAAVSPLYVAAIVLSLLVCIYPGMLLRSIRDIKSWRTGIQPALTFVVAASSGLGLLVFVAAITGSSYLNSSEEALAASTLSFAISMVYATSLRRSSFEGARATYSMMASNKEGLSFYPFLVLGCVLPIACFLLAVVSPGGIGSQLVAATGAVSLLAGSLVYRLLVLRSARHEPLTLLRARGSVESSFSQT